MCVSQFPAYSEALNDQPTGLLVITFCRVYIPQIGKTAYDEAMAAVRTRLGPAFSRAWEEGHAMTFAEAIAYAQSAPPVEEEPTGTSLQDAATKLHPGGHQHLQSLSVRATEGVAPETHIRR